MNRETAVAIIAGFGWLFFIVMLWVNGGLARKIMRQKERIKELEKPKEPEKPKKPSRVLVRTKEPRNEVVYGSRFGYRRDGGLEITDVEGLICASFGAGKWISAIVESEPKTPKQETT